MDICVVLCLHTGNLGLLRRGTEDFLVYFIQTPLDRPPIADLLNAGGELLSSRATPTGAGISLATGKWHQRSDPGTSMSAFRGMSQPCQNQEQMSIFHERPLFLWGLTGLNPDDKNFLCQPSSEHSFSPSCFVPSGSTPLP